METKKVILHLHICNTCKFNGESIFTFYSEDIISECPTCKSVTCGKILSFKQCNQSK
jgi:hypothetical protein